MAIQLDLFDLEFNRKEAIIFEIENLQSDIEKMRKSFFVRLNAQEKKCETLLKEIENKNGI